MELFSNVKNKIISISKKVKKIIKKTRIKNISNTNKEVDVYRYNLKKDTNKKLITFIVIMSIIIFLIGVFH